jgi:hypothetical protein
VKAIRWVLVLGVAVSVARGEATAPPLEGPVTYVAFTITDEGAFDEFDFSVSALVGGISGSTPTGATASLSYAILDSGAATHLVSYPDSALLGLDSSFTTDSTLPVGGAGGTVDIGVSVPIGFFLHGVQDLNPSNGLQSASIVGQGNFPCGVNTLANFNNGSTIPTVIGAPLFAYYPVEILNSQRVTFEQNGETLSTASAQFFSGPTDPALPTYGHKFSLELLPAAGAPTVSFFALPDFVNGGYTFIFPALIGGLAGSLYQTASENLQLHQGSNSITVKLIVDTAAQATLISETVAFDLGVNLSNPDFEVPLQGISGTNVVPGIYLDSITLPTSRGGLTWTNVPVVVVNIQGPDGTMVDGIFGSNLLADRDYVFNGADSFPYVEASTNRIPPDPVITEIRRNPSNDVIEVDWYTEPAAAQMQLESSTDPAGAPASWTCVSTGELGTIRGTLSVTGSTDQTVFRLVAP